MNKDEKNFSFLISDKSDSKETSIELSGTSAVLGISLIAFVLGYAYASTKKKVI